MNALKTTIALGLTLTTLGLAAPKAAYADGAASTRNIIFGAAAIVAGAAIESNVARKNHAANTVEGYLPNGATVYDDGRVVEPNGTSYYPGNQDRAVTCNDNACYQRRDVAQNGNGGYGTSRYGGDGNGWRGRRR